MKKILQTILCTLLLYPVQGAWAFNVDGINYSVNAELKETCKVIRGSYSGDITIPSSVTYNGQEYKVTAIGDSAFLRSSITSISIPESVTNIGKYAFYYCSSLTSIGLSEGLTCIGEYSFRNCSSLTSISIPESVTSIGDYAFYYCSGLTSIEFSEGLTCIGKYSFVGCSSLSSISLPESVTSIGDYAFWSCSGLTSITLPESVTSIGKYAFSGCSKLSSVNLSKNLSNIGIGAFNNCSKITSITLPEGLTEIGRFAFAGTSISSIFIPATVTQVGGCAFGYCKSLSAIDVALENSNYTTLDGILYNKQQTELEMYPSGKGGEFTIPSHVTSIGDSAFMGCSNLTSITFPESVNNIGISAFYGCSDLTSITLPKSLTSLGNYAFSHCTTLTSINLPEMITSIGLCTFSFCSNLSSIEISGSLTNIGDEAFRSCQALTTIELPEELTNIGYNAFEMCSSLTSIVFPEGLTSIGSGAFRACESLSSIELPEKVTSIGDEAFNGCAKLTDVTFKSTPTTFGNNVFHNCIKLSTANIPVGSYNNFIGKGINKNYLKETVLKIGQTGYSTICSISDLVFTGTGVTAYTAAVNESGNYVTLNEVTQAAAGEGLVVSATAGTYVIPTTSGLSNTDNNDLTGVKSTDDQPIINPTDNCYALRSYDDGTIAFAKITSSLTFPYGKAYLELPETMNTQTFAINFDTATGIEGVKTEQEDGAYYTITGMRVAKLTKGLYIHNRKKVFIK